MVTDSNDVIRWEKFTCNREMHDEKFHARFASDWRFHNGQQDGEVWYDDGHQQYDQKRDLLRLYRNINDDKFQ